MKVSGKKIKEARKRKGLTQEELAEQSKMNLRTIQRIENNENIPRGKSLNLICEALDIHIEDLFENEKTSRKKTLLAKVINGIFLIVLNIIIVAIFGYLTIDSDANLQSKFGALLLSFFLPVFIVIKTSGMNGIERFFKFGTGLIIYTIIISTKTDFPSFFMTGLLPGLFILLMTLFYGDRFLK